SARAAARVLDAGAARLFRRAHLSAGRSRGDIPYRVVGQRRITTFSRHRAVLIESTRRRTYRASAGGNIADQSRKFLSFCRATSFQVCPSMDTQMTSET